MQTRKSPISFVAHPQQARSAEQGGMNMNQFTKLILSSVAVVFLVAASANGASMGDATCIGGSIASGVYSNLNIAGPC
jgi:hypothetical protein